MKVIVAGLIGLMSVTAAFAQQKQTVTKPDMPMDPETNLVSYKGVVEQTGVSKSELYKRAYIFFNTYYPSKAVVQSADSVKGIIEGKAQFDTQKEVNKVKSMQDRVKYSISIAVKDGKYKYEITKINLQGPSYTPIEKYFDENGANKESRWSTLTQADEQFQKIEQAVRDAMDKPSSKVKKDDW